MIVLAGIYGMRVNTLFIHLIHYIFSSCRVGKSWMHHLFIYLFICWSSRIAALFLCYSFTAICTSKGDISASAIYYFWRFFLIHYYVGRPSYASLAALAVFLIAFISLCSLYCIMLSANDTEVVDCGHEYTLLLFSMFL